jgi:hypothetical protein
MTALNKQEGGTHYKDMPIQPIEFITKNKLDWYQGNIVKYASRHHNKGGASDLRKVIHYAELALEAQYGQPGADALETITASDDALGKIKGSGACGGEHAGGVTYSDEITMWQAKVIGAFADPKFLKDHIEKLNPGTRLDVEGPSRQTTRETEGWIEWNGGDCPVPKGAPVDIVFRDNSSMELLFAQSVRWAHGGSAKDVVKYRVVK